MELFWIFIVLIICIYIILLAIMTFSLLWAIYCFLRSYKKELVIYDNSDIESESKLLV